MIIGATIYLLKSNLSSSAVIVNPNYTSIYYVERQNIIYLLEVCGNF